MWGGGGGEGGVLRKRVVNGSKTGPAFSYTQNACPVLLNQ